MTSEIRYDGVWLPAAMGTQIAHPDALLLI